MATILNIETSTDVCSVSLAKDGKVISLRENLNGQNHAKLLSVYIMEVMQAAQLSIKDIHAVAVSGGPGSYTGLRIGVSMAKGICYASGLPLIAVSSLEAMAHQVIHTTPVQNATETKNVLYCPMIDARRMEVYTAFYNQNGDQTRQIQADIVDHQSYLSELEHNMIYFFGNGALKCREAINHPNAIYIEGITTSSKSMAPLAEREFQLNHFEDVAYYEPFYLKDFVATVSTKNIFNQSQK